MSDAEVQAMPRTVPEPAVQAMPVPETVQETVQPPRKRQRRAPTRNNNSRNSGNAALGKKPASMSVLSYDEEKKEYRLELRSTGPKAKCKTILAVLSRPESGEECMIAQEPMEDYKLPFLAGDAAVCEDKPELVKASLPCGHSFNALALLYHFAKNAMTCPCCRAGHAKTVLADSSIPSHIRRAFTRHLLESRAEETREQIASDALLAMRTLDSEVSRPYLQFSNVTRVTLLLAAWDSTDEARPRLQLEIPLTPSLSHTGMVFESYGYYLHQLNLNLRLLPFRPRLFHAGVAISQPHDVPNRVLFQTAPFALGGSGTRLVFATHPDFEGNYQAIEMVTDAFPDGQQVFSRIRWTVPVFAFTNYLLQSVSETMPTGDFSEDLP